ncbi:MAG: hypothetical protein IPI67_39470 [Myxococcales bacterium]|nr:hypothetical protein [Myxococcales bacterium]
MAAATMVAGCGAASQPAPTEPARSAPPPVTSATEPPPELVEPPIEPLGPAPSPPTDAPQTEKSCSIWSGGPLGDAPPPKGYDPNPCGPAAHCVCNAQAGYSCSGTCQPK